MAHNIHYRNGRAAAMLSVKANEQGFAKNGIPWWDGAFVPVPEDMPWGDAKYLADMAFRYVKLQSLTTDGKPIPGNYYIVREFEDGTVSDPFDGSVGKVWDAYDPDDLAGVMSELTNTGEVKLRSLLVLGKGEQVCMLGSFDAGQFSVTRPDGTVADHKAYLYARTGLKIQTSIGETNVCVVCANTDAIAENADGAAWFRMRHTRRNHENAASKVATYLGLASDRFAARGHLLQGLSDSPLLSKDFATFAAQVALGEADADKATEEVNRRARDAHEAESKGKSDTGFTRLLKRVEAIEKLYHSGDGNFGKDRLSAYNAVTQWIDRGKSADAPRVESVAVAADIAPESPSIDGASLLDSILGGGTVAPRPQYRSGLQRIAGEDRAALDARLNSAWFGDGAKLKALALDVLVKGAGGASISA